MRQAKGRKEGRERFRNRCIVLALRANYTMHFSLFLSPSPGRESAENDDDDYSAPKHTHTQLSQGDLGLGYRHGEEEWGLDGEGQREKRRLCLLREGGPQRPLSIGFQEPSLPSDGRRRRTR